MTILIVGFATLLAGLIAVVIDVSALYLQRQSLDNVADGAALHAVDRAAQFSFEDGLGAQLSLEGKREKLRLAVSDYLRRSNAHERYPGITPAVTLDDSQTKVTVSLSAPVVLPLPVPGIKRDPLVSASSSAAVLVVR